MESGEMSNAVQSVKSLQPALFEMGKTAEMRFCRILNDFASPFSKYRAIQQFNAATDEELHSLRIAAKKMRYSMELFSAIWPGGLSASIEKARSFQNYGGAYNDWNMLRSYLDTQVKRLDPTDRLSSEICRLADFIELRKFDLKSKMREALMDLQENLAALQHMALLLTANPNLGPSDVILSGIRIRSKSKAKSKAKMSSSSAGSAA
jgi:CHAD domain-containing protein